MIGDVGSRRDVRFALAAVVGPLLAQQRVDPAVQPAFSLPLVAFPDGPLARRLHEFVGARCVAC